MPFVDIIYLKKSSVGNGVISYRRRKTGQWLHVSLTPQLKALIRKYANESEYVFPVLQGTDGRDLHRQYRLALERVNRYLKRIALECGVSVPLTTYVARHSWATLARESGAPVAVISEGLGHTSEKTTQIYLKEFDRRIVDLSLIHIYRADISIGLQHFDRPGSYGDIPAVPRFFDFGQWAGRIAGDEVNAVFGEQMKRTVIWEESTERFLPSQNGFEIRCHSGLTVYVEQPELVKLNEYYRRTAW